MTDNWSQVWRNDVTGEVCDDLPPDVVAARRAENERLLVEMIRDGCAA
jgi:hypothetical protein